MRKKGGRVVHEEKSPNNNVKNPKFNGSINPDVYIKWERKLD